VIAPPRLCWGTPRDSAPAKVGASSQRLSVLLLLLSALAPLAAQDEVARTIADRSAWTLHEVGDGVWLRQRAFPRLFTGAQFLSVLEVTPGLAVRFDLVAPGMRRHTSAMGRDAGALAAINGGFFAIESTGLSTGLLRLDDALVVPAKEGQGSVGLARDGSLVLAARATGDWPEMREALGAGPMLLIDGKVLDHGERQRGLRHPRTAIGSCDDGKMVWLVVDGRAKEAVGMTFEETATVLQALGCRDGLNLDGGGSSTLWLSGRGVCNHPCDDRRFDAAGERAVANALLLHAPAVVVVDDEQAELRGGGWQRRLGVAESAASDARAVFTAMLPFAGRWRASVTSPGPVGFSVYGASLNASTTGVGEFEVRDGLPVYVTVTPAAADFGVDAVRFVQVPSLR
jgi:hypothetical protein